jgi:DHA1 family bicyclomycin/chloramphenicol resistance-like MFS transporter
LLLVGESLPEDRRHAGGLREAARHAAIIWRDPQFIGYFLAGMLAFGAIYSYIGGSSFVLQNVYGVSPQRYGLVYGTNALGVVIGSQINRRLISRFAPASLLAFGLSVMSVVGVLLLVVLETRWGGLASLWPLLFMLLTSLGFVSPNAMALAVRRHRDSAGTAIAMQGSVQFAIGGVMAPIVGIGGRRDATPMAVAIAAMAVGAMLTRWLLIGRFSRSAPRLDTIDDLVGGGAN